MSDELPIATLVSGRCKELSLRPVELIRRCGYKNVSKGLRRLEHFCQGNFTGSDTLTRALPAALDVPDEAIGKPLRIPSAKSMRLRKLLGELPLYLTGSYSLKVKDLRSCSLLYSLVLIDC